MIRCHYPAAGASLLENVIEIYGDMFHERWDPSNDYRPIDLEDAVDLYLQATGEGVCACYEDACELASVLYQEDEHLEMYDGAADECLAVVKSREEQYEDYLDNDGDEDEDEDDGSPEDEARYEDREPCDVIDFARFRDTGRVVSI